MRWKGTYSYCRESYCRVSDSSSGPFQFEIQLTKAHFLSLRLSLSNNHLFHIPYRFAECSHLRYLNIRANNFREFPKGVGWKEYLLLAIGANVL